MQYKKLQLFFCFLVLSLVTRAQQAPENTNFISPVNFPMYLSGNYGEIRSGHFHAGIDIKTQGVIGKEVVSVENGYISRIKISANSYGKTLYITHPNGYTTVYGHLDHFTPNISKFIKSKQYEQNEFEINYFPEVNQFKVSKGELLAYSGNTGGSDGPHLHFEIRETNSQIPVNPLLFHFQIEDDIPPIFYSISFYPIKNNSFINYKNDTISFRLKMKDGVYSTTDTNELLFNGECGIGVEIVDYLNNSRNKCGIYSLQLKINNQITYSHLINKISFNETSYVKSHIDYKQKIESKKTIQKTFIEPNNKLSIYKSIINNGIYDYNKDSLYIIELIATDTYGNKSTTIINAKRGSLDFQEPPVIVPNNGIHMNWELENIFENEDIKITIPRKSLYNSFYFNYYSSNPTNNSYSKIHHIHNENTPIHKKYSISLKIRNLPEKLYDKAFIALLEKDKSIKPIGGTIVNQYIVAETKQFGNYTVLIDTIKPIVNPILKQEKLLNSNKINFSISDDLSGIKSYNGYIDNKWALFEYDLKNDLLSYTIDEERIKKNKKHELELFVIDNTGNITTYYTTFFW
ncbi:MAG: M23 family metallopeptidase [Bacteroidales bacterium]|nr:M23 family metallopeptidase [Bacteroidales bacterium]